ncbi:HAD hydrolase-like protein [Pedobacter insulae]|uniref:FMN phosphatase YigB, HAD superfamily n=1 Tax=Pedobacter insulae TaxID=414048 RepID=A0A1I2VHL2_9SPHI|nr:HAD hydrolase-like protein [Pedobacter insulae]SFG88672.1 FMN phosphatase YigB, HAD superfamily [Pedobacter insulae]
MAFETHIAPKTAFIFGFDNVLYPEKDYLLQVYYLFSEFMEYTEQLNAKQIVAFMQSEFAVNGNETIFDKTAAKFDIPEKYRSNFNLLHENARLPLKLLPYQQILAFLQEIVVERKAIYLLVTGNPTQQLNKIRQLEWHGLEQYLKVYFSEEIAPTLSVKSFDFIVDLHHLNKDEVLYIGATEEEGKIATQAEIGFLFAPKLF